MSVRGFDHVAIPIERVEAMLAGGKAQADAGNAPARRLHRCAHLLVEQTV